MSSPTRVICSVREWGATDNPFLVLLRDNLPDGVNYRFFSWRAALVGRYDVFHVHWPENLYRARRGLMGAPKVGLYLLLLLLLALRRVPIVWTVHNATPHQGRNVVDRTLHRLFEARVSKRVFMTAAHDSALGRAGDVVVRHGAYGEWYPTPARPRRSREGILFFGLVREYKNLDELMAACASSADPEISLTVLGRCTDSAYEERLIQLSKRDPRIRFETAFVPHDRVPAAFADAGLVVLPYAEMGNSGVALLALTFGVPVLMRDSPIAREFQAEIGSDWVHLFAGRLDASGLESGLAEARRLPMDAMPDLSARDWQALGQQYAAAFTHAR